MAAYKTGIEAQVQWTLAILFGLFMIANGIFHALAVLAGLNGQVPALLLPEETAPAVRLLIWVIGFILSWYLARILYMFLLRRDVSVGDSTNMAYGLLFYLTLTASTFSFFGIVSWFWLPLLFLILLIYTIFGLWSLVGGLITLATVGVSLLVITVVSFLVA